MLRCLYLIASQLKWALDFLLPYNFFQNQHFDMSGRSEELCLDPYEFNPAAGVPGIKRMCCLSMRYRRRRRDHSIEMRPPLPQGLPGQMAWI
ncbi:hypothetical protein OIU84_019259 [Salix udensis]|uniref:Uncharacterized protein n=1 Tax=Salix udensis TaxID=889485 RepID=A0AAD6L091_9ROSI|nr:hypothetical protein OIU84_019259 [Salix udensis]